jgi:hypothetical protein
MKTLLILISLFSFLTTQAQNVWFGEVVLSKDTLIKPKINCVAEFGDTGIHLILFENGLDHQSDLYINYLDSIQLKERGKTTIYSFEASIIILKSDMKSYQLGEYKVYIGENKGTRITQVFNSNGDVILDILLK